MESTPYRLQAAWNFGLDKLRRAGDRLLKVEIRPRLFSYAPAGLVRFWDFVPRVPLRSTLGYNPAAASRLPSPGTPSESVRPRHPNTLGYGYDARRYQENPPAPYLSPAHPMHFELTVPRCYTRSVGARRFAYSSFPGNLTFRDCWTSCAQYSESLLSRNSWPGPLCLPAN